MKGGRSEERIAASASRTIGTVTTVDSTAKLIPGSVSATSTPAKCSERGVITAT